MTPAADPLVMYGETADLAVLEWAWVTDQLESASTYWLTPASTAVPHPRPVWGVFDDAGLFLSVGSPTIARQLTNDGRLSVNLGSDVDVVIVEGRAVGERADDALIAKYDAKYTWSYDVGEYGPLVEIRIDKIVAWQSAGWAGRDGFQAAARWTPGS